MENASKALIIAGAILLSILLISLGIMVYNNAKGTISDANLNTEEAQTFNTKITQYCGPTQSGSTMNSLIDAIAASNGAQNGKSDKHYIRVKVNSTNYGYYDNGTIVNSATNATYPKLDDSKKYKANYKAKDGYIYYVDISEV